MGLIHDIWSRVRDLGRAAKVQDEKANTIIYVLSLLTESAVNTASKIDKIILSLEKIQALLETPPAVELEIELGGDINSGENGMLQVATNGSVLATLVAQDAAGNPGAKLDSVPAWSVSDETMGAVNAAEDGMTAIVVLTGKLGTFKLKATAKVGESELSDESDEIEVVVGAAALLRVDLSAK